VKVLARLSAGILGLALALAVISWTADSDLLQPASLLNQIPPSTYTQVAAVLPGAISRAAAVSTDQQALLSQFIDAGLVQHLANTVVTGELDYLHGQGAVPMLDLSPVAAKASMNGAELSPQLQTFLDKPQPLGAAGPNQDMRGVVTWLDRSRWLAPLVAVIMAVLIWFLAKHHRLRYLADSMLVALVAVGAAILLSLSLPSLADSLLATSTAAKLAPPIKSAAAGITARYNHTLIIAAAIFALAALGLYIAQYFYGRFERHHHRSHS